MAPMVTWVIGGWSHGRESRSTTAGSLGEYQPIRDLYVFAVSSLEFNG